MSIWRTGSRRISSSKEESDESQLANKMVNLIEILISGSQSSHRNKELAAFSKISNLIPALAKERKLSKNGFQSYADRTMCYLVITGISFLKPSLKANDSAEKKGLVRT